MGQAVMAVVELNGDGSVDEAVLRAFVQTRLARFKAPKRIFFKATLGRAANGKADYKAIKAFALDQLS